MTVIGNQQAKERGSVISWQRVSACEHAFAWDFLRQERFIFIPNTTEARPHSLEQFFMFQRQNISMIMLISSRSSSSIASSQTCLFN